MTRLITGETELYHLAKDPHEFNNLAGDSQYAPVIKRLSKHLTFRYPTFTAGEWMEAEDIRDKPPPTSNSVAIAISTRSIPKLPVVRY